MKKARLHIFIVLGVFLCTFILGSFLDLTLSKAIYSKNNGFGLFISVIGTLPGYAMLAFLGGGLFDIALKKKYHIAWKILLYVVSFAAFVLGVYFSGREFFGENGFTNKSIMWLGYLIALPFMCLSAFFGYKLTDKSDNDRILILYIILLIAIFMSLVPGVTLLKSIFHRPRYRTLSDPLFEEITFHNWWERCTNYKDLMALYDVSKEEFKSFPSGHAGASMCFSLTMLFLPLINSKYQKYQIPVFYIGLAWTLLVAFSRILVGAHFLSDVSMGALITCIFLYVANEVAIAFKFDKSKEIEEPVVEENVNEM